MMKLTTCAVSAAISLCVAVPAFAQDTFYYPPTNRTEAQQKQDRYECHEWAVAQSRFDPVNAASAQPAAPASATTVPSAATAQYDPSKTGRAVVGSAAAGAAIGEATDNDVGKSAAIGGAAGLLRARMAEKKATGQRTAEQMQAQAQSQANAQRAQAAQADQLRAGRDAYNRARSACFKGRGYTISD